MNLFTKSALLMSAFALIPSVAMADNLTVSATITAAQAGEERFYKTYDGLGTFSAGEFGRVTFAAFPLPSIAVQTNSLLPPSADNTSSLTEAQAALVYTFSISGPDSNVQIPVRISGNYMLDSNRNNNPYVGARNFAIAYITAWGRDTFSWDSGYCSAEIGQKVGCGGGMFAGGFTTDTSHTNSISIRLRLADEAANVDVYGLGSSTSSSSAFIDPYIQIDPVWLAEHPGYQVDVGSDVGNLPAVPEPNTAGMFLLGLAAIISTRRGRTPVVHVR
ncbi:MAG: PEP-CTERM sorting domain-containing protein [Pseudomonadota bacterium]